MSNAQYIYERHKLQTELPSGFLATKKSFCSVSQTKNVHLREHRTRRVAPVRFLTY